MVVGKILRFLGNFKKWDLHVGFLKPGTSVVRVLPVEQVQFDKEHKAIIFVCQPEQKQPQGRIILPAGYERHVDGAAVDSDRNMG